MSNIFFNNWNKPWSSLPFNGEHLDAGDLAEDELPTAYAEIGYPGDNRGVEFGVVDYLDNFHKAHNYIDHGLLDEHGFLTMEAMDKLRAFYTEQLHSARYCGVTDAVTESVAVDDSMGDDPHYCVNILVPYDTAGTVEEVFETYVNSFFACVQNVTDPGTFNEPYIFSHVHA